MKNAFNKILFRSIRNNKIRFLSIMAIIAIGVGFYAGINATEPEMMNASDQYYKKQNLFDLRIYSPLGLEEKDFEQIRKMKDVQSVQEGYMKDLFLTTKDGNTYTVRIYSYDPEDYRDKKGMNRLRTAEGRLPKKQGEIAVEAGNYAPKEIKTGGKITLAAAEGEQLNEILPTDTYTVTGKVYSPLYINYDRGQTTIGDGSVDLYAYIPEQDFLIEANEAYITTKKSEQMMTYSQEYEKHSEQVQKQLNKTGIQAMKSKKDALSAELNTEKVKLEKEKHEAEKKFTQAEQKLHEAEESLNKSEKELEETERAAKKKLDQTAKELDVHEQKLTDTKREYEKNYARWKKGKQKYIEEKDRLHEERKKIDEAGRKIFRTESELQKQKEMLEDGKVQLAQLKQTVDALEILISDITNNPPENKAEYSAFIDRTPIPGHVKEQLKNLPYYKEHRAAITDEIAGIIKSLQTEESVIRKQIDEGIAAYEKGTAELQNIKRTYTKGREQFKFAERELQRAKEKLDRTKLQLDHALSEIKVHENKLAEANERLKKEEEKAEKEFNKARTNLSEAKVELAAEREKLEREKEKAFTKMEEAEDQITSALEQLNAMPEQWFVETRESVPGYSGYRDDAERIGEVAKIFPLFFFLVAALVCMTSMTRMIEEERGQIGILKALGYSTPKITANYLFYALVASLTGAVAGLAAGFHIFPSTIMNAYGIMYNIPVQISGFHMNYAVISLVLATLTTTMAALAVTVKELRSSPSVLLQPRAPKPGKRIWIEKIPPLWSRLSFSHKVTFRNIFRYKQRFFMTVLGIGGCTGLLITGFGLSDSINDILDRQFHDIFLYDGQIVLDPEKTNAEDIKKIIASEKNISSYLPIVNMNANVSANGEQEFIETNLMIPEKTKSFDRFVHLHERRSKKAVKIPDEGAVISEKLARLLDCKAGDEIYVKINGGKTYPLKVHAVVENYLSHYIYVTPEYYEKVTGERPEYNSVFIKLKNKSKVDERAFKERLMEHESVLGAVLMQTVIDEFKDTLDNLNYVVFILIVSAGLLAVVVLYNLTNINITERIREIATIKVLGFRSREVDLYVYRENIILTIIGIMTGFLLGIVFHKYVIHTMEIDSMMFGQNVHFTSYIWSVLLTMLFTIVVNFLMHFKLKKIDMVESLKSPD